MSSVSVEVGKPPAGRISHEHVITDPLIVHLFVHNTLSQDKLRYMYITQNNRLHRIKQYRQLGKHKPIWFSPKATPLSKQTRVAAATIAKSMKGVHSNN